MTGAAPREALPFRQMVERLPYPMVVHHERGHILFANESASALAGLARGDTLVGRPITSLFAPPYLKGVREHLLGLRTADADLHRGRERLTRVDGGLVEVEVATTPFVAERTGHVQLVFQDVGPRLLAERVAGEQRLDERRQAEGVRLTALARLAGGVAHQFNNVLATVLGRASVLRAEPASSERREDLTAIVSAAMSGGEVVARLLGFARGGLYQRQRLDVRTIVRDAGLRAEGLAGTTVTVRYDVLDEATMERLEVTGDQVQLATTLDALVDNALEALGGLGTVSMRCQRVELSAGAFDDVLPGSFAHVVCLDDGAGMSAEDCAHAIEPYFSTRGEGRGLGLAMVHGIVTRHGGVMRIKSVLGHGTSVELWLPLAAPFVMHEARVTKPTLPARVTTHQGHVLVIDDEALVRASAKRVLGHLGYTVVEAVDGLKGLVLFAADPGAFDCVLLDMRMPGINGDVVLRKLVAIRPDVPVLICTGYTLDSEIEELLTLGRVGFIQKPYGITELAERLAQVGVQRAAAE